MGRATAEVLRSRGHDVWIADLPHSSDPKYVRCDLAEYREVESLFEKSDFDYVYHLGAEFGRFNGEQFYERMWKANAIGTKNMIRLQEKKKFKMIFFSSSEIYGDYEGVMSEEVPIKFPIRQLNDYAISKWVNEKQIMNSADRYGTETVRVRLFNSYGPGEYYSSFRSVVCIFVYRAMHDMPYTVYTKHRRTLTYIDDMVNGLCNIVDNFKAGEVYNIAGDQNVDMKELSDIILRLLGKQEATFVRYETIERHNTLTKITDNTKAKRDLNYKTSVTLEEGLKRTIEWQRSVYF